MRHLKCVVFNFRAVIAQQRSVCRCQCLKNYRTGTVSSSDKRRMYLFYVAALWSSFTVAMYKELASCYSKCMKSFSVIAHTVVTSMLFELGLVSTHSYILHNSKFSFECSLLRCRNMLVSSMLARK